MRAGFGISPGPGRSRPCPRDQEARPRSGAGFLGGFLGLRGPRLRLGLGLGFAVALDLRLADRVGHRHTQGLRHRLGADLVHLGHLVGGQPAELARVLDDPGGRAAGDPVSTVLTAAVGGGGGARRRAMSGYGLVLAAGVAAGQVLGGILVTADLFGTGWRPVFLVNVPAGLAVLALAAGRLPSGPRAMGARLDLGGAAWLAASILALIIPLTFGADTGWPAWAWPVLACGAAALAIFARHERRLARNGGDPLIDPTLLAQAGIRRGLAGIFILDASYGGLLFTTALYLQHALHQSPLASGLTFGAYAAGFATASFTWA